MRPFPCMLIVAFAAASAPAAALPARDAIAIGAPEAMDQPLIQKTQYQRYNHGYRGNYYRNGGYYRGGRYYGGGYNNGGAVAGAAIAGGILGLATGAIIAGSAANAAPPPPPPGADPNWVAYCARKYQSFDPGSGTYLAYDGNRYVCQ